MKLGLGTVQLGLDYGIANKDGKPDRKAALDMLLYAYKNGIFFFDTAAAYGDSENLIGDFLSDNDTGGIEICTKGKAGYKEFNPANDKELEAYVLNEVEGSLDRLGLKRLDFYLLHNCGAIAEKGIALSRIFKKLKAEGIIGRFGASVYSPTDVSLCLEHEVIDVIQLPFNILDTRLGDSGLFREMKGRGIEVHARSIYLQGALLLDSKISGAKIPGLASYAEKLGVLAREMNLTVKQLAFLFVRENKYIDKMIVGCESIGQIEENIKLFKFGEIDSDYVLRFVTKEFSGIEEKILNPALWKL